MDGKNLDSANSPGIICEHLYNEIPLHAKRFDPDLNAEYRACVGRETLKRYALIGSPFVIGASAIFVTAVVVFVKDRRRRHL